MSGIANRADRGPRWGSDPRSVAGMGRWPGSASQRRRSGGILGGIAKIAKPLFCVPKCKFRAENECRRSMHINGCIRDRSKSSRIRATVGNRCGIMPLFDASMIDIKSQKSASGSRRFCYKSLSETQNSASPMMYRCQEGRDMFDMRNCAFRCRIRAKT